MVGVTDRRLLLGATALALSLLGFGFFTDVPALLAYPASLFVAVLATYLGAGPGRRRGRASSGGVRRKRPGFPKEKR